VFTKCANPDCFQEFDYRQGRFFRFHQSHRADEMPANTHSVHHFWLCETCSHDYTLEYKQGLGVVLMFPYRDSPAFPAERLITVP
jgi:hypothetical protein